MWQILWSILTGLIGLVAAAGFWLERKLGLWAYILLLVASFLAAIGQVINEYATTGAITYPGQRLITLVVGVAFLVFFYAQRDQFQ